MTFQLKKLAKPFERASVFTGQAISWLTVIMVLVLALNVLSSWLFNVSAILLTESVTWMHSANFLLAAAYTLNRNEHVRVDIFYAKMSARSQAIVDLVGSLLLLLPTCLFILWSSWSFVALSWRLGESSAEAGGMPALFILKGFLLVMPLLLILEVINQVLSKVEFLSSHKSANHSGGSY